LQLEAESIVSACANDLSSGLESLAGSPTIVTVRGQLLQEARRKEKSGHFNATETPDSRSAEEGINAIKCLLFLLVGPELPDAISIRWRCQYR